MQRMLTGWTWAGLLLVPALGLWMVGCGGQREDQDVVAAESGRTAQQLKDPDASVVTQLATEFMEALSSRDTERLDQILAPQARLFSIREGESGPIYGVRTREEFLEGLASGGSPFVERIWEPIVEVAGRVAMVWAPYDFHMDGGLSHCGIDILALMKMAEGWKVTSITYNVVREGCEPSPLGVPEG